MLTMVVGSKTEKAPFWHTKSQPGTIFISSIYCVCKTATYPFQFTGGDARHVIPSGDPKGQKERFMVLAQLDTEATIAGKVQ